jgi:predicted O-methyltransferase YrrM
MTTRIREARRRLVHEGPAWTRPYDRDFETISLPERDCDLLRDLLVAERAEVVVEVGLAYGSSALAIGEALVAAGRQAPRHVIIDPFQESIFTGVGWAALRSAGLEQVAELLTEWSSIALPRLVTGGFVADAAFVDGSHRFHEVFVDLYFLRKLVRPGGLVILDDTDAPSVGTAVRYFERNLEWAEIPDAFAGGTTGRCRAFRLPDAVTEPPFEQFRPF